MINLFAKWLKQEEALAATEAALIFPLLLTMLMGTFDMGNAILANQKTIRASQVVADLVTRTNSVDDTELDEAIMGGQLALAPLSATTYGVDIASVRFDEDAVGSIEWQETENMDTVTDVLDRVDALAEEDSGVVMVTVEYIFIPTFSEFVVGNIAMQEVAFARGRNVSVVERD